MYSGFDGTKSGNHYDQYYDPSGNRIHYVPYLTMMGFSTNRLD